MSTAKTILITGASDGIGAAAARQLHADGHHLVLVGRSPEKTRAIAQELDAPYYLADFAELTQVKELAAAIRKNHPRIDVLANNAGGMMGERTNTVDGFEKTWQVNHLAGFLLTHLLMDVLVESRATIIQTSSVAAKAFGKLDADDFELTRNYTPARAYGNAKLANILFTKELQRRYGAQGLNAVAFHPGVVATNFASDTNSIIRFFYHSQLKRLGTITPGSGADQLVWFATSIPGTDWQPGQFYAKRKIAKSNPQANDVVLAHRLWAESARQLDIQD